MTGFDPAAATAAYLARLPPDLRHAAAVRTETAHWLWAGDIAVMLAACWLIARLGLLRRLQAWVEARSARPWLAVVACGSAFAAIMIGLATLVAAVGAAVSGQAPPPAPYGLWLIGAMTVLPLLYAAARAAQHRWWLWSGAAVAALALLMIWLPFVSASGPADLPTAPQGPTRAALLSLATEAGLDVREIYLSPSSAVDADVTGWPGRPRIVITRGLLLDRSPAEARATVGHLIGHYVHQDQLTLALTLAALAVAVFYAVQQLFGPLARLWDPRPPTFSDPAGLPIAAAIGILAVSLATVGYNNVVRLINVRADQYSLDHAREPDGLAQALLASDRADKIDPSTWEELVFYNHPALKGRIAQAMAWKAARP